MLIEELYGLPGHLIRRLHQISGACFAENLAGHDLTSVQYAAMVAISCRPEVDATRLSDLIAFDRATLGGVLDRLEAKNFVSRSPSKQDRRIKTVVLTPAGEALLADVEARVLKAQDDMLKPLSEAERRRLIALLQKLVAHRTAKVI